MDDDSKTQSMVKWALGAMGLGALASLGLGPKLGWTYVLLIVLAIVVLALVLFGGYYLWQRRRARRQREQFTSAIEQQTAAAPRAISDPNKRASLDKVRQKFQTGLQEFKSRGKDIYKLPWYVIIGESGSGKSEAIRHSGIDFPPGMQDELQGSGGTVNMDWWFSNRGIILDTAGSMLFSESRAGEAPEWGEFLRLLKKSRPHCPINGLMLVLSIESLIKDSSDRIAQKAGTLAKQLELIQKTLDVRFPVYLIVTKCDLLTGFREFFDNIDDPLLQHQMFGWSNPDPLDSPFRPELVEQHLKVITAKIQRRRLALLRDSNAAAQFGDTQSFYKSGTGAIAKRRLDEVDSMCALPESIARLAPRLRRYLETIFIAGEWSAKPVFLRGIYFTSSMREGKALDEAIAFATGLPLDQLPENRSWEKNRAFFLRDLFHEKVFREFGLVTRATNTLKMLRQRQLLIFGSAAVAILLLITFASFGYFHLRDTVGRQSVYWAVGANTNNWNQGIWSPGSVIQNGGGVSSFTYAGTNQINVADKPGIVDYYKKIQGFARQGISVGGVFTPFSLGSRLKDLPEAQQALFDGGVLRPLIIEVHKKMENQAPDSQSPDSVARHRAALLSLMQLQVDKLSQNGLGVTNQTQKAEKYLRSFLSYLTDSDWTVDTNLVNCFVATYGGQAKPTKPWPVSLNDYIGGDHLSNNAAIRIGLDNFRTANRVTETRIASEVQMVDKLVDELYEYRQAETNWMDLPNGWSDALTKQLLPVKDRADAALKVLQAATNFTTGYVTNIGERYKLLETAALNASAGEFQSIIAEVPVGLQTDGIFGEISRQLRQFAKAAGSAVHQHYQDRKAKVEDLDANYLVLSGNLPAYERRASLYTSACALAALRVPVGEGTIGNGWKDYKRVEEGITSYQSQLALYKEPSPFAARVASICNQIAADVALTLKAQYVDKYVTEARRQLGELVGKSGWDMEQITNTGNRLLVIEKDLKTAPEDQKAKLTMAAVQLTNSVQEVLAGIKRDIGQMVGFPVLLDATNSMSVGDLRKLSELTKGLMTELNNSIWQVDPVGLDALRTRCGRYVSIVNALTDEQGNPASWQLKFLPQESTYAIKGIYPDLETSLGGVSSRLVTIRDSTNRIEGNVSQGLTLRFFKSFNNPGQGVNTKEFGDNWSLVRLIKDSKSERKDGGATWWFRINLIDGSNTGDMVFEGSLVSKNGTLPETSKWPKQ